MYGARMNCWEFMGCGDRSKTCPAFNEEHYNGINRGKNAGRVCWAVAGTMCRNHDKLVNYGDCVECEFFNYVHEGEDKNFTIFEEAYKRAQTDPKNMN